MEVQLQSIGIVSAGLLLTQVCIFLASKGGRLDLLAPPMWVALVMWLQYFLPATTLPVYEFWIYPHTWPADYVIRYPLLLSLLACLAFLLGYNSSGATTLGRSLPIPGPTFVTNAVIWGSGMVGVLAVVGTIYLSGGITNIAEEGSILKGTGVFSILGMFTLPSILFLWMRSQTRPIAVVLAVFYFVFLAVSQARGGAMLVLFLLFVLSNYQAQWKTRTVVFTGACFLIAIVLIGSVAFSLPRIADGETLLSLVQGVSQNLGANAAIIINRDLSRLEQLSIILEMLPAEISFFWGLPMIKSLFGPLRSIVFRNDVDWRIGLTSLAMYGEQIPLEWGMGGSGVGEWYANFGPVGVVLGWIIYGVLGRTLYEWLRIQTAGSLALGLPIYVFFLRMWLGAISETVGHYSAIWMILPVLVTCRWFWPSPKAGVQHNRAAEADPGPGVVAVQESTVR